MTMKLNTPLIIDELGYKILCENLPSNWRIRSPFVISSKKNESLSLSKR